MSTKEEFAEAFRKRTKIFALDVIKQFQSLPKSEEAKILGKQLLRSDASVAANYRAVCRSRSKAEFFAKLSITVEEADESLFWLELLSESGITKPGILDKIQKENLEILSVLSKARSNTK